MIVWQGQFLAIIKVIFFPYSSHMDQFLGFVTSQGGFDNAGNYTVFLSQFFSKIKSMRLCCVFLRQRREEGLLRKTLTKREGVFLPKTIFLNTGRTKSMGLWSSENLCLVTQQILGEVENFHGDLPWGMVT